MLEAFDGTELPSAPLKLGQALNLAAINPVQLGMARHLSAQGHILFEIHSGWASV